MGLGSSLNSARKKSGLSQEEVAEKLGVSRQTISKWELDETLPDIQQAKRLAGIYHLTNQRGGRGQGRLDEGLERKIPHPGHIPRYGGNGKIRAGTAAPAGRSAGALWLRQPECVPGAQGYSGLHLGRKEPGAARIALGWRATLLGKQHEKSPATPRALGAGLAASDR